MRTLEEIIRPPESPLPQTGRTANLLPLAASRPGPRRSDALCVGLLAGLAAVLLSAGGADVAAIVGLGPVDAADRLDAFTVAFHRLVGPMASMYLPMALGMLLCLRCGAIDLSVWAVAGLGGVVAAAMINAKCPVWAAMLCGVAAGAAVGAASGLLVAVFGRPSVVVTVVAGLLIVAVLHYAIPGRQVAISDDAFRDWHLVHRGGYVAGDGNAADPNDDEDESRPVVREMISRPIYITQMLLSAGLYSLAMLVLLAADWRGKRHSCADRRLLFAAMAASGALSGAAGVLWLMNADAAPVPTRLVDDLTPAAGALLAGGWLLAGRGRTMLAGVMLPAALVVVTLWRMNVLPCQYAGYSMQLCVLMAAVAGAHMAARRCDSPAAGIQALGGAILMAVGIMSLAGWSLVAQDGGADRLATIAFGAVLWLAGGVMAARQTMRDRKLTL